MNMGNCCCCCMRYDRKFSYAYRTELGSALVKDLLPKLPPQNSKVIRIRLKSIQDLEPMKSSSRVNPYVEMKLKIADPIAGDQYQRSSYKPDTLKPKWEPDEKFQFILTDSTSNDIIISVYSSTYGSNTKSVPLGDAIIKSKDIKNKEAIMKTVKIVNPNNGFPNGHVNIQIQLMTIEEALSSEEHTIYQYERWQPALDPAWGFSMPGHLLPTDPGAWSSIDGEKFGWDMETVSPQIEQGWLIRRQWYTLANDDDAEGWQYAMDFSSLTWYAKVGMGLCVRRRAWRREVAAVDKMEKAAVLTRRGRKISADD